MARRRRRRRGRRGQMQGETAWAEPRGDATRRDAMRRGPSLGFRERAAWRAEWDMARQEHRLRARDVAYWERFGAEDEVQRAPRRDGTRQVRASRNILTCATPDWLVNVQLLVDLASRREEMPYRNAAAVELVCRAVHEQILQAREAMLPVLYTNRCPRCGRRCSMGTCPTRRQGLRVQNGDEARRLLMRLTPEMIAAKRWHRVADRMVVPRSVFGGRERRNAARRLAWVTAWPGYDLIYELMQPRCKVRTLAQFAMALCAEAWSEDAYRRRIYEPWRIRCAVRVYLRDMYRWSGVWTLRAEMRRARVW